MAAPCSGLIGWRGYCLVAGFSLPVTSGGFTRKQGYNESEPIGIEATNALRCKYNYSLSKATVDGSLTCEIFGSGTGGKAFNTLLQLAVGTGAKNCSFLGSGSGGNSLTFCPDGGTQYTIPGVGKAVITSVDIRGNNGGIPTASFGFFATDYTVAVANQQASLQFETAGSIDNLSPLPYYSANFTINGSGDDSNINNFCTDFSVSVNSEFTAVYGFCDNFTNSAIDLRSGMLDVGGQFSYYSTSGSYPNNLAINCSITIDLHCCKITFPNVLFKTEGVALKDANTPGFRTVNWQALGGGNGVGAMTVVTEI